MAFSRLSVFVALLSRGSDVSDRGKVVSLKAHASKARKSKAKATTLCANGHHKWRVDKDKVFDSKQGGLVTRYQCDRCGEFKVKAL